MTRVYADMAGDLFHHGHVEFLRRARELGDELVVGVHSDATVATYKGPPVMTMHERLRVIEACRFVDEVIADAPLAVTREWIDLHRIDVVVHGDDLDDDAMMAMYSVPADLGMLRTVPYTRGISSSEIRLRLTNTRCD